MIQHIYAPAVGVLFRLNTATSLVGNTGLAVVFTGPSGVMFTRVGTLSATDNNVVEYTVQAADFDPADAATYGDWVVYATAAFGGNPPLVGDISGFQIRKAGSR